MQKKKLYLQKTSRLYPEYNLALAYGTEFNPEKVVVPEDFMSHIACFADYFSECKDTNIQKREYYPLFINVPQTLQDSYTEKTLKELEEDFPNIREYHAEVIKNVIGQLNKFVDISYDGEIISFIPRQKFTYLQIKILVTRLRIFLETPYFESSLGAVFLKDDFPDLSFEEINYLLDVFIYYCGTLHGIYQSLSYGHNCSKFMYLKEMMELANEGEKSNINTGDNPLLDNKKVPFFPKNEGIINRYIYLTKNYKKLL